MEHKLSDWLPTTRKEMQLRGWDCADVILFSADAYVDHPSFGAAVIGRLLEAEGLRVCIVPQPDWHGDFRDFKKLGRPRLWFGIAPGCMDSMVNKYTAARRLRSEDAYSPDPLPLWKLRSFGSAPAVPSIPSETDAATAAAANAAHFSAGKRSPSPRKPGKRRLFTGALPVHEGRPSPGAVLSSALPLLRWPVFSPGY